MHTNVIQKSIATLLLHAIYVYCKYENKRDSFSWYFNVNPVLNSSPGNVEYFVHANNMINDIKYLVIPYLEIIKNGFDFYYQYLCFVTLTPRNPTNIIRDVASRSATHIEHSF